MIGKTFLSSADGFGFDAEQLFVFPVTGQKDNLMPHGAAFDKLTGFLFSLAVHIRKRVVEHNDAAVGKQTVKDGEPESKRNRLLRAFGKLMEAEPGIRAENGNFYLVLFRKG